MQGNNNKNNKGIDVGQKKDSKRTTNKNKKGSMKARKNTQRNQCRIKKEPI